MRIQSLLFLGLAATLASCAPEPADTNPVKEASQGAEGLQGGVRPILPVVAAPLSRRDLLLAAAEAASAFSVGAPDNAEQRALDGRLFSFAIRLCEGDRGLFDAKLDKGKAVLRIRVQPDLDAKALGSGFAEQDRYEAVEGFWVPRPWLLDAACPVADASARSQAPPPDARATATAGDFAPVSPTIGIAQFLEEGSARSPRRAGRAYEVTRKISPGTEQGAVDLLIEGRISALADGRSIICSGPAATAPPQCIISVRVDQVILRQPGGNVLAKWGNS